MADYFDAFSTSSLPFRWEVAAILLVALFLLSHIFYRRALAAYRSQPYSEGDVVTDAEKRWGWVLPFGQFTYGTAIFVLALYGGGWFFTLLVGGLLVSLVFMVATNVRGILYYASLVRPGAARGNLWMSSVTLIRHRAYLNLQGALICLLAGVFLANFALLGGALILGSTGLGYLRRARRAEARL